MHAADATLALVAEQPSAHSDWVYSVDFSPDGTRVVSGSKDTSIKLWGGCRSPALRSFWVWSWLRWPLRLGHVYTFRGADGSTLALAAEMMGAHSYRVLTVAFSFDGTRIVSGSQDRSIRLWGEIRNLPSPSAEHILEPGPQSVRSPAVLLGGDGRGEQQLRYGRVCACVAQMHRRWRRSPPRSRMPTAVGWNVWPSRPPR